jgi:predicted permease
MKTLQQDVRYALRTFRASPWFLLAAVASLALGIGANTAIFSVVYALLLRPLPYPDVDRLAILWNRSPGLNIAEDWFSTAQYFDIKTGHSGFEQVAIAIGGNSNLTGSGAPERVGTIRVSSNLLPMLGASAAEGRLFTASEDQAGAPAAALLSHGLWERRFSSDRRVVGQPITLNGKSYQVVGILPRPFSLPREVLPTLGGAEQADILLNLPLDAKAITNRDQEDYNILGKLKPGVTLGQAQAEMNSITARLRRGFPEVYPPNGGLTFSIVPLMQQVVGDVRATLFVLLGSVGFVLLIACANVANLLLSRAVARQKELAVRTAMGAQRSRLVRQLLTESILLALAGGVAGTLLALWSIQWIQILGPKSLPRLGEIEVNGAVLAFTLVLSLLTGVLFGLFPSLRASRVDLQTVLKETGRGGGASHALWGRGNHLRRLLVVSEIALAVVLLIGAGLLVRSFEHVLGSKPGFNAQKVLSFELTMTGQKYNDRAAMLETYRQLTEQLEHLPGATLAGVTSGLPLNQSFAWGPIVVEGRVPPAGEKFINADVRAVGGNYFQTMEIPLLRGRLFNARDTAAAPRVIVVDEQMAKHLWPGQDAIGKRIKTGGLNATGPWMTVVGVVGRVKHEGLDSEPRIAYYLPHAQFPVRTMSIVLKTQGEPALLGAAARDAVRSLDADLPIYSLRTMQQRVDLSLARRRFAMTLLGVLALIALVLASIGVYGVMAYLVAQGSREIGIRIALGATENGILRLVLSQGLALATIGIGAGLLGAAGLSRFLGSLLFGVPALDAATFSAIGAGLLGVALLACYVPARRASRLDPANVLRSE